MVDSPDVETPLDAFAHGMYDGAHTLRGATGIEPPPDPAIYYVGWVIGWAVKLAVILFILWRAPGALGLV